MNSLIENIAINYSVAEIDNLAKLLLDVKARKEAELNQSPTLYSLREEYGKYISENHTPKYLRSVIQSFNHLLKFFGEEKRLIDIRPLEIERFKSHLMKRAPKGYAVYFRTLRAAFSVAVRWGLIPENPFKGIRINKRQETKKLFITEDELSETIGLGVEFLNVLENDQNQIDEMTEFWYMQKLERQ